MNIVLTGVPGTGKSTIAKQLAVAMKLSLIDLNAIAKKHATKRKLANGEHEINLAKLKAALLKQINGKKSWLVEGHLACELKLPADLVVVLRCDPRVLRRRLVKRRYSQSKTTENLLSEAEDYCLVASELNYHCPIIQINTTKQQSTSSIMKKISTHKTDKVNWQAALMQLAKKAA